jgi:folylpolyglutamate synthase/dihydropteroate synthase
MPPVGTLKKWHNIETGIVSRFDCNFVINIPILIISLMSTQKRTRTEFTLKEKKEIIDAAKNEPNISKLSRGMTIQLGRDVKRTTVRGIIKNKLKIEAALKAGMPRSRINVKLGFNSKLDEGVIMWLKQARGSNLPVSGDLMKEKALKLANLMKIPEFKAIDDGWIISKNATTSCFEQSKEKQGQLIQRVLLIGNKMF